MQHICGSFSRTCSMSIWINSLSYCVCCNCIWGPWEDIVFDLVVSGTQCIVLRTHMYAHCCGSEDTFCLLTTQPTVAHPYTLLSRKQTIPFTPELYVLYSTCGAYNSLSPHVPCSRINYEKWWHTWNGYNRNSRSWWERSSRLQTLLQNNKGHWRHNRKSLRSAYVAMHACTYIVHTYCTVWLVHTYYIHAHTNYMHNYIHLDLWTSQYLRTMHT